MPGKISISDFVVALRRIELTPARRLMLREHLDAPNKTITATEMSAALGSTGHRVANAQYGRLAGSIAMALGYKRITTGQRITLIAECKKPDPPKFPHWRWVMHSNFAAALDKLGV